MHLLVTASALLLEDRRCRPRPTLVGVALAELFIDDAEKSSSHCLCVMLGVPLVELFVGDDVPPLLRLLVSETPSAASVP